MKQIDYFKFLKDFPEFIDIDETIDVKLILLDYVKKKARRTKGKVDLLPVRKIDYNEILEIEYFRRVERMNGHSVFKIKFRKEVLFSVSYLGESYEDPSYRRAYMDTRRKSRKLHNRSRFMEPEEITNLKRTMLIDNMLK